MQVHDVKLAHLSRQKSAHRRRPAETSRNRYGKVADLDTIDGDGLIERHIEIEWAIDRSRINVYLVATPH
jgi:hypothetical protein